MANASAVQIMKTSQHLIDIAFYLYCRNWLKFQQLEEILIKRLHSNVDIFVLTLLGSKCGKCFYNEGTFNQLKHLKFSCFVFFVFLHFFQCYFFTRRFNSGTKNLPKSSTTYQLLNNYVFRAQLFFSWFAFRFLLEINLLKDILEWLYLE